METIYVPTKTRFSYEENRLLGVVRALMRGENVGADAMEDMEQYHSVTAQLPEGILPRANNPNVTAVASFALKPLTKQRATTSFSSIAIYARLLNAIENYQPQFVRIDERLMVDPSVYYCPAYVIIPDQSFKPLLTYSSGEYDRIKRALAHTSSKYYDRVKRKTEEASRSIANSAAFFFDLLLQKPQAYMKIVNLVKQVYG